MSTDGSKVDQADTSAARVESDEDRVRNYLLESYHGGTREWKSKDLLEMLGAPNRPSRKPGESEGAWLARRDQLKMRAGIALKGVLTDILESHNLDIQATRRGSYTAIASGKAQGDRAVKDGRKTINRGISDMRQRIIHNVHEDAAAAAKSIDRLAWLDDIARLTRKRGA